MIIRPSYNYAKTSNYEDEVSANELNKLVRASTTADKLNLSFDDVYRSNVFCEKSQFDKVSGTIDVVLFCGYAGAGHYSAAYAIAKTLSDRGYNVAIVDAFRMLIPRKAKQACDGWLFVSKHAQRLFKFSCKLVSKQIGVNLFYNFMRRGNIDSITKFLTSHHVRLCISTYIYPNVIIGKFAKYVDDVAIVATDYSSIGMLTQLKGIPFNDVHVIVPDESIYLDAKKRYPAISNCKDHVSIGGIPSLMTKRVMKNLTRNIKCRYSDVLTFFVGGGLGIGYGIKGIKTVFDSYDGTIVIVCGDNEKWIKKVKKLAFNYPNKKIIVLGYVSHEVALKMMLTSRIVVSKAGGITSAEMTAFDGYKIFFGSILGHEENQAKMFARNCYATFCKNLEDLSYCIKNPQKSIGIYNTYCMEAPVDILADCVEEVLNKKKSQ